MTRQEFVEQVVRRVTANWPHAPWPDVTLAKVYEDVHSLPVAQVLAAVETIYRDGRDFPPSGGAILRRLAELTDDAPDWGEAWATLARALRHSVVYNPGKVRELVAQAHPAVCQFADEMGLRALAEVGEHDPGRFAQARERYLALVARRRRDLSYGGLSAAGLPALERARRAPRQLGAALGELGSGS